MKGKGKIFITALMLTLVSMPLMSQTSISGVVNTYTSIEELVFPEGSDVANAALVSSTSGFSIGDTVMVYQPKGFEVEQGSGDEGIISLTGFLRHVGKYTMLIIHDISLDTIIFNNSTGFDFAPDPINQYQTGEVGQLIKVASYENAEVNGTLTAGAWDPVTNTGGVLAVFVKEKLTLNAPIDVTGKGFKGGDPDAFYYNGLCYSDDPTGLDNYFYLPVDSSKAGLKGEGAADTTFPFTRGKGSLINGGGGGNAKYSGGGGGSNYSSGGAGGNESDLCTTTPDATNGQAGYALGDDGEGIYTNDKSESGIYVNRIFMGGGGGSGTQHIGNGYPASRGGNGGGIVIIIADTLESTIANPIIARGESVTPTVAGSGGGGGGGGCIVLDISHYQGEIKLNAEGGDGGNTNDAVYTGPGGGGGGGIYWVRNDSTNINSTNTVGQRGQWDHNFSGQAGIGSAAVLEDGLRVPLNGFLFNTLPRDQTVCSDEKPERINATYPKGGNEATYIYEWYTRPVIETVWNLDATNTGLGYTFSGPLTESTDIKRVVKSGSLIASDSITYTVLQRIEGNDVLASDTVCYGLPPIPMDQDSDSTLRSANVATDTTFKWIGTVNDIDWFDAPETNNKKYYAPSELFETTTFARIARSGVCDDTSNQVIVTVLPAVEGNSISQEDTICYNQTPSELIGTAPIGGEDDIFTYKWFEVNDNGEPVLPDSVLATTQHYSPPALIDTKNYRRGAFSGIQDACKDTTTTLTIEVLPLINNNELISVEDTVCELDAFPDPGITAKSPGGGDGIYRYIWQISHDEVSWGDSSSVENQFNLSGFPDKRYVRRLVKSGSDDVCQDYSDTLIVNVIPSVNNNSLITADFKECQDIVLPILSANTVNGGDLSYGTLWESSTDGINFADATGANDQADSYSPGALLTTTYFRREVWSSDDTRKVCDTYSDTLKVTIKPRINENFINEKDLTDSICFDTNLEIPGSNGSSSPALSGGDDDVGSYSFLWQTSSTGIDFDFTDAPVSDENYLETSVRNLQYLRRIVTRGVCEDTSDVLEAFVRRLPHGVLSLAPGQDNIICESDVLPLNMLVVLDGEADVIDYSIKISHVSEEGAGTIDTDNVTADPGIVEYYPFTDDSATYDFVLNAIVDNNGCIAPIDSMSGAASVKVYQKPLPEIMQMDTGVCGPTVSLEALADQGGAGHWILKSGNLNAVFTPDDFESTEVTTDALTADSEVMKYGWVLETPRCVDTAFVEIVHYKDPDHPPYFQSDTVKMFFSTSWMLEADTPTAGGGYWTVADGSYGSVPPGSKNPGTQATQLELDEANTFVWNVSNPFVMDQDSAVCGIYSDELTIFRLDLTQYDGFSPGEDDMNKYYVMRGLNKADAFAFTVYNSWGTPIKTMTVDDKQGMDALPKIDQGSGEWAVSQEIILWDGTISDNATLAPDGAYYYHIRIFVDDEEYEKKGYIILKTRK